MALSHDEVAKTKLEQAKRSVIKESFFIIAYALLSLGFVWLHYHDPTEPRYNFDWIVVGFFVLFIILHSFGLVIGSRNIKRWR